MFLTELYVLVPDLRDVVVSVHCHDDLGPGGRQLAGRRAGRRRQVECAINGIGERAGNASLEEIVMLLHTRRDRPRAARPGVETTEIARTSRAGLAPDRLPRCSPTRRSSGATRSRTRPASTRTAC